MAAMTLVLFRVLVVVSHCCCTTGERHETAVAEGEAQPLPPHQRQLVSSPAPPPPAPPPPSVVPAAPPEPPAPPTPWPPTDGGARCTGVLDCQLNGRCEDGRCVCVPAWLDWWELLHPEPTASYQKPRVLRCVQYHELLGSRSAERPYFWQVVHGS